MKRDDYVRTKSGWICKLGYYNEKDQRWITYQDDDWYPVYESSVKKSSPNIIDLIEVGDYVNGRKVEWVGDNFVAFGRLDYAYEEDIKSIVTKEQFESMEYKVVE